MGSKNVWRMRVNSKMAHDTELDDLEQKMRTLHMRNGARILKYEGTPIAVIGNDRELKSAVIQLLSYKPCCLGFDIEWKPNYKKGQNNPAALIQIAHKKNHYYHPIAQILQCLSIHASIGTD